MGEGGHRPCTLTTLPGSPKILIHTRHGKIAGIYCDKPAEVLEVDWRDRGHRRPRLAVIQCTRPWSAGFPQSPEGPAYPCGPFSSPAAGFAPPSARHAGLRYGCFQMLQPLGRDRLRARVLNYVFNLVKILLGKVELIMLRWKVRRWPLIPR